MKVQNRVKNYSGEIKRKLKTSEIKKINVSIWFYCYTSL